MRVSRQGTERVVTTPNASESQENTLKNAAFYEIRFLHFSEVFQEEKKSAHDVTRPAGRFQSGLALPSIPRAVI